MHDGKLCHHMAARNTQLLAGLGVLELAQIGIHHVTLAGIMGKGWTRGDSYAPQTHLGPVPRRNERLRATSGPSGPPGPVPIPAALQGKLGQECQQVRCGRRPECSSSRMRLSRAVLYYSCHIPTARRPAAIETNGVPDERHRLGCTTYSRFPADRICAQLSLVCRRRKKLARPIFKSHYTWEGMVCSISRPEAVVLSCVEGEGKAASAVPGNRLSRS